MNVEAPSSPTRKRASTRTGCPAKIQFLFDAGNYVVNTFVEKHNHPLIADKDKQFMKSRRKMTVGHQKLVLDLSKRNYGPNVSHKIAKEFAGSYANVGPSLTEYKNLSRDVRAFIGDDDAQIVINKFIKLKECCSDISFDYCVDTEGSLSRLFWADAEGKNNYSVFSDVMSFDATYRKNK